MPFWRTYMPFGEHTVLSIFQQHFCVSEVVLFVLLRCTRVWLQVVWFLLHKHVALIKLQFMLAVPSLLHGVLTMTQTNAEMCAEQMILLLWLHIKWLPNQISSTNNSLTLTPLSSLILISVPSSIRRFTWSILPHSVAMCRRFPWWTERKLILTKLAG